MSYFKVESLSIGYRDFNEDELIINDDFYAALDGATGLVDSYIKPSDASFLVNEFKKLFKKSNNYSKELKNISAKLYDLFINKTNIKDKNLTREHFPSIGLSFVDISKENNELRVYTLGDPIVYIKTKKGSEIFKDSRLSKLDNKVVKRMIYFSKKENKSMNETRLDVLNLLKINRNKMNKFMGYDVFSIYKNGINFNIRSKKFKLDEVEMVCLATDGFMQAFDVFHLYKNYDELFSKNINEVYEKIKNLAENDAQIIKYPRLKKIDDISIIKLTK